MIAHQDFADEMLSVGEAASVFAVNPNTIKRWFDSGRLKGHKLPGSNHRRILAASIRDVINDEVAAWRLSDLLRRRRNSPA